MYQILSQQPFLNRVSIELKRAERYRIFISLLIYDLSESGELPSLNSQDTSSDLINHIAKDLRSVDSVTSLKSGKIAVLFPETNRQGAEVVSKRISELIKTHISEHSDNKIDHVITPEMASYPDAAGAKSINDFISEYSDMNRN